MGFLKYFNEQQKEELLEKINGLILLKNVLNHLFFQQK